MAGSAQAPVALSLYVHIPFCAARCPYCDFATAPASTPLRAAYLETLAREIALRGGELGRPRVATVYFGGGTPSLLELEEIAGLARAIGAGFELRTVEVTLEANPATLERERLAAFRDALGLTRVSLGAQSLDPLGLRALARTHRVEDVARSAELVRGAGASLNLDLIFGWPGQDRSSWRRDLERALALGPDHLSCYPLTLVHEAEPAVANWPGGGWRPVERWRARAAATQPEEDAIADMYLDAEEVLARAGFVHYEIANWARPGHEGRHNLAYWRDGDWLGVGLGAHSHLRGRRFWNDARLPVYLERWSAGVPATEGRAGDVAETAMLALRLSEGIRVDELAARYGARAAGEVRDRLRSLDGAGLLEWRDDRVALTQRGRLLSNEVFVRLL
jgi:oxygen-independent coproporphyrinogen-3 oxidase